MRAPAEGREQRIALLDSILPQLLALARVPEKKGRHFDHDVRYLVRRSWHFDQERHAGLAFPRTGALAHAARSMRSVSDAIGRMDEKERKRLELAFEKLHEADSDGESYYPPTLAYDASETIAEMVDALQWAIGAAEPDRPVVAERKQHKRGRPLGTVKNWPLRSFVRDLYQAVDRCGGKLSFNPKDGGSGRLVQALRLIEPCLPIGFVPKALPAKSMERWIKSIKRLYLKK